MPVFPFFKFSPSGNTTLFLLGEIGAASTQYCREAIKPEGICAEQCGMVEPANFKLQMGAGEFCANACRAFGALLDMITPSLPDESSRHFDVHVSGMSAPVKLVLQGRQPFWQVSAAFGMAGVDLAQAGANSVLARLPGITHLLISEPWPDPAHLEAMAETLRKKHKLEDCAACGLVWWRQDGEIFSILPHVHVPAAGTSMLETSCGSASLALALALRKTCGGNDFSIRQPGGDILHISVAADGQTVSLSGEVKLCASGELYLPDFQE